jgi:hypothetical protein
VLVRVAHPRRVAGVTATLVTLAIAAAGAAATIGCGQRARSETTVDVAWTLSRREVGPATLTMTLRDASGTPVQGAIVRVEGHMTHPGMAPIQATATAAADRAGGVYHANLVFTMAGDWVLLVSAVLPDGRRVERRLDIGTVRPANARPGG